MKTRYKIIILIVAIPVGLFAAVFFGATIMSLTNTGYYYTPTEEELPTKTMIEQANALAVTQVFREKYPDSEPLVDRGSSFGIHYQAYPDSDGPRDPNFDYDERNPYVALVVPFTDDKVVGKPYIYCVQNYVRSERIYEEDYDRFYKVQSHEDIINYLQNESCFFTEEMVSKAVGAQWTATYAEPKTVKEEFTDEEICGVGNVLVDGICIPSESQTESNTAFPAGYPRVPENDMWCSTSWVIHHKNSIDAQLITEKIRQIISERGEGYDVAERKITIKTINENTSRINVGGIWDAPRESGDSYSTLFMKTFGFIAIEEPRVVCA